MAGSPPQGGSRHDSRDCRRHSSCNRGKSAKRRGQCGRAWYIPSLVWANQLSRILVSCAEPLFLVDKVKQRLSGGKAAAILYQYRLPFLAIGRAVDRDMRRDQHVWHAPERVVGGQRLGICDIE